MLMYNVYVINVMEINVSDVSQYVLWPFFGPTIEQRMSANGILWMAVEITRNTNVDFIC